MSDNEEAEVTRRIQALTCPCCLVGHKTFAALRTHLEANRTAIAAKLEAIKGEP